MKEGKSQILTRSLVVMIGILIFATIGLLFVTTRLKTVELNYFGEVKKVKTIALTVESFLNQNRIYVGENQVVFPAKDSKITKDMEIKIYSEVDTAKFDVETMIQEYTPLVAKIEEVVKDIPFNEQRVDNPTLTRGTTNVVQEGQAGQQIEKYIVKCNDNGETYRSVIETRTIAEAKDRVIEVGTKLVPVVSRSSKVSSVNAIITDGNFKVYNIRLPEDQQRYAYNLCKQYGIDYELFIAMMYKESGFNQYALGGGNSYGLCQIHVSNHASLRSKLGISNFYNAYDNMKAGAYLLSQYIGSAKRIVSDSNTVLVYALNSYNMGEGAYYRNCYSRGIVNRQYSTSVMNLRNKLINQGWL